MYGCVVVVTYIIVWHKFHITYCSNSFVQSDEIGYLQKWAVYHEDMKFALKAQLGTISNQF